MDGLSRFTDSWQLMQTAVAGVVAKSPGSGMAWHCLQASPLLTCILWLNGSGCTTGWRGTRGDGTGGV